jgi:hypothetical protein
LIPQGRALLRFAIPRPPLPKGKFFRRCGFYFLWSYPQNGSGSAKKIAAFRRRMIKELHS